VQGQNKDKKVAKKKNGQPASAPIHECIKSKIKWLYKGICAECVTVMPHMWENIKHKTYSRAS
jgi:hypothetical protein